MSTTGKLGWWLHNFPTAHSHWTIILLLVLLHAGVDVLRIDPHTRSIFIIMTKTRVRQTHKNVPTSSMYHWQLMLRKADFGNLLATTWLSPSTSDGALKQSLQIRPSYSTTRPDVIQLMTTCVYLQLNRNQYLNSNQSLHQVKPMEQGHRGQDPEPDPNGYNSSVVLIFL